MTVGLLSVMVLASVLGDTWRLFGAAAVLAAIIAFWYVVISRFGSMASPNRPAVNAAETAPFPSPDEIGDPRFAGIRRLTVYVLVGVSLVMIFQVAAFVPLFVSRFGWSR